MARQSDLPRNYLTVAEVYQMQHLLIDRFGGGLHGIRDKNAIVWRQLFFPVNDN